MVVFSFLGETVPWILAQTETLKLTQNENWKG